ncbi:DNA polymerase zeta catalytic subunit isoform X2 [Rhododendron vialii]|nr:DNA polymerase zeta catalytic subunit isoform X2 [Rhododendron vialii]XP_058193391.1 DNA polymerase zeta catalytic subunit isoform X2 [Rhododendron vialii]XP_058193392.1 DNA polymerase zeta catalytic subunit isoform X2 [Rhododendron vialii]
MGYLHVSKMKFRHPVPDALSRRKDAYNENEAVSDKSTYVSSDSNSNSAFHSPIWISSTIPDGWMWEFSSHLGSSFQDVHLVKRQSTCELEGDTTVEDILNQQFKMYSSLSQTRSEVKMVQSLIPIWEEEYERTGMHDAVFLSDTGKPLPEDVLRILSHGLEFENKLMEMCNESKNDLSCTPLEKDERDVELIRPSPNEEKKVELGLCDMKNEGREVLKRLIAGNETVMMLPQGLLCKDNVNIPGNGKALCPKLLLADDIQTSRTIGSSDVKVMEKEALRLLSWLASSQAAEDINSDDELACESILTPLLPATTMDKVLEKANMDFESESQQECQDILDSVDHSNNFEDLKGGSSSADHNYYLRQPSRENIIPQVDGSADDQIAIPTAGKSSKVKMSNEIELFPQDDEQEGIGSSFTHKSKKRKPLWGSLPFSLTQKVNVDLEPFSRCCTETVEGKFTGSGSGNQADRDVYDAQDESKLVGSSVRDLMRRKRMVRNASLEEEQHYPKPLEDHMIQNCGQDERPQEFANSELSPRTEATIAHDVRHSYHIDDVTAQACGGSTKITTSFSSNPSEFFTSANQNSYISVACCENDGMGDSECVDFKERITSEACVGRPDLCFQMQIFDNDDKLCDNERLKLGDSTGKSSLSAASFQKEILGVDDCVSKNAQDGKTLIPKLSKTPSTNIGVKEPTSDSTILHFENCGGGQHGQAADLSVPISSISSTIDVGTNPMELIGMTFHRKPPMVDLNTLQHILLDGGGSYGGISVQRKLVDEILPFFESSCLKDGEVQKKSSTNNDLDPHKRVVGVPTHYQNDGSYLYMLTPVVSPPSVDSVSRWLLHVDSVGDSGQNYYAASMEPSSPKGSSGSQIGSQGSWVESCGKPVPEPGSVSVKSPILGKLKQQIRGDLNAEMNPLVKEVTGKQAHGDLNGVYRSESHSTKGKECSDCLLDMSQISGPDGKSKPTPVSQIGFRDPASFGGGQQLTLLSVEVQAESRGELRPDPRFDAVNVIVLAFQEDNDSKLNVYVLLRSNTEQDQSNPDGISDCKVFACSEEKLFSHFMNIIRSIDPDILMGWDIQGSSLGYLAERAMHLGISLLIGISRTPTETKVAARESGVSDTGMLDNLLPEPLVSDSIQLGDLIIDDEWGRTHASGVHVGGRVVLNVWRLMRGELKLNMYTVEAVAEAVLRRRVPYIQCKLLARWFSSGPGRARYRCIEYVVDRAKLNLEIMNQLDMINRTSELARVFGIDFFSVLSRGSQYRVESMLIRLARTQNYVAISPGSQQVASQPAMECLPLVMEPESGFYADPVVVLDFQSLYPSMIIAYNLCFCTCLGNVVPSKANTLGVSSFSPDLHVLRDLKQEILLTPNGVMYVPSKVRKGVLPRLLEEILSTRIMVKQAMKKLAPSQQVLHRIFNARQLALKLIANVTYGYTAAGFSGRMPCAELADSIVQCGRRTLENAISFVNSHDRWNAKVIYGDTDSMFVLLRGRTMEESFEIGREIASAVTAANPNPVTLKMEKVYHSCFLLTKKRYVGYSYESPDQVKPVFDAKGIETVRRDTCGSVAKIMEQSLRIFFECKDINQVKAYLLRQWKRILSGRVSLQDFVFAKEVRLGTYSTRASSSLPPAAIVAAKAMRTDPRAEPRYGERISYVVVHGEPGSRLVDMVVDPLDLLAIHSPFRLNDIYYITKQIIPALQRAFGLVGVDLNQWFSEMPRLGREFIAKHQFYAPNAHRTRIDYYYLSKHCILCGELVQGSAHLCGQCLKNEAAVAIAIIGRTSKLEQEIQHLAAICRHCRGGDWTLESGVQCTSLACSVFYERRKVQKELQALSTVATEAGLYPRCMVEWF